MTATPADRVVEALFVWCVKDNSDKISHAVRRFQGTGTFAALCGEQMNNPRRGRRANCPRCVTAGTGIAEEFLRTRGTMHTVPGLDMPFSRADAHRHAAAAHPLVIAVNREREANGGRWPALTRGPLDRRWVNREMEALLRQHCHNVEELIREVTGYLDLAVDAAYDNGKNDGWREGRFR